MEWDGIMGMGVRSAVREAIRCVLGGDADGDIDFWGFWVLGFWNLAFGFRTGNIVLRDVVESLGRMDSDEVHGLGQGKPVWEASLF